MLVSELISGVRTALHDENSAVYLASEALATYNRAVQETQSLLMMIGARIAADDSYITGDGTNYSYDLPATCIGIVPGTLRARSPITATSNYLHGQEIALVDDADPFFTEAPTAEGQPLRARVNFSSDPMKLVFPCILTSGHYYDFYYYPEVPAVATGFEGQIDTPWNGRMDRVLARCMEYILRAGAEFVGEARDKWLTEAQQQATQLLGFGLHQKRQLSPSWFSNGAWLR